MRRKHDDLKTMLTVAVGTGILTVAFFWAAPLEAGDENQALSPTIAKPTLKLKGAEITLAQARADSNLAGTQPEFELTAINTTGEPVTTNVRLVMTAASPADALSRVVRIPARLWECDQSIVLGPHEKKTITIATKTSLPERNLISVLLSEAATGTQAPADAAPMPSPLSSAQAGIAVLTFSTAPASAAAAEALPNI